MKLIFTKGGSSNPAKYDRLDVVTAAGPQPPIDCSKQGIILHDMVHFAVESEVSQLGFLDLAAAGGGTGFKAGNEDAHARSIERLVETVQAEAWGGAPSADTDFINLHNTTCDARGDMPLALDLVSLTRIRARLADLTRQWRNVPPGGTLELVLSVPSHG